MKSLSKILTILFILGIIMMLGGYIINRVDDISFIGAILIIAISLIYTVMAFKNRIDDIF